MSVELKELMAAERPASRSSSSATSARLALFSAGRGSGTVTVGRLPETDLAPAWDGEVSGLHARAPRGGRRVERRRRGLSTNGTHVKGQRVAGRRRLRDGDRVRLGRTVLVFRSGGAPAIAPTAAAVDAPAPRQLTSTQRSVLVALCRPYRDGDPFATPATNQGRLAELLTDLLNGSDRNVRPGRRL
jgi:FHA domain